MKRLTHRVVMCVAMTLVCASLLFAQAPDGASLYRVHCASCHDAGSTAHRVETASAKWCRSACSRPWNPDPMITMAVRLTASERRAVAEFVTGKPFSQAFSTIAETRSDVRLVLRRVQSTIRAALEELGCQRLEYAVADGLDGRVHRCRCRPAESEVGVRIPRRPDGVRPTDGGRRPRVRRQPGRQGLRAQRGDGLRPLVLRGGRSSPGGRGDRSNRHVFRCARRGVLRRPVSNLYAVDAATGALLWKTNVDDYPIARVTGSPVFHNGRLYVGVASGEETPAQCRTTSAAVFAAAWSRSTPRPASRSGRRTRSRKTRCRRRRTGSARRCGGRRARRSGRARRSTSAMRSTSPPATTTATRRRGRATRSSRSTSNPERFCGPNR